MSKVYVTLKFNDGIETGSQVFSLDSLELDELADEMLSYLVDVENEHHIDESCFVFQGKEYYDFEQILSMLEELDDDEDEINLIVTDIEVV